MLRLWILVILITLAALGIAAYVRREIRRTRAQLKNVDRSKLRDLSKDEWDRDDWDGDK